MEAGWEVDGPGSGSSPKVAFDIVDVEPLDSAKTVLVNIVYI
jgi:hypothetical protein